uniref:Mitochondrial inner membrane protease ATP23 n=1 Tax=Aceria tosichella TaxID=561515 RepID=A0A6G1S6V0_9ACAR
MKEHLKDYFPDRFDSGGGPLSLGYKIFDLIDSSKERRHRANCERKVAYVFNRSNELQLLAGAMKKYGCDFNLLRHVSCEKCKNCAGGFDPDTNQIIICYTESLNEHKIMATMMHEMVHMFDYCRVKFDFNNLEHVACSEIRAANLTYCSISDRLMHGGPGLLDFKKTHQYCVKDIAFQSIKAYSPETDDSKLWSIVDKVFPDCYNDLEPFGRRPTSGVKNFKHSYRERFHYGYVY